jgi:hypothetical protein
MTRFRIAGYHVTPLIYRDDGARLTRVQSGASEVQADEIAKYLVGLQRQVAELERQANAEPTAEHHEEN